MFSRPNIRSISHLTALVLSGIVLVAACGSDDAAGDTSTTAATTAAPGTTSPTDSGAAPDTTATTADRGEGPAPEHFPDGYGSAEADGVFPRTVVHYQGTTELAAEPQRIVVIGTGQMDVMLTLGILPIGAVAREGAETVQPYLVDAYPELADGIAAVQSVGTNSAVNYEAIAALDPDLIFDNGGAEAENYGQLAAIARR